MHQSAGGRRVLEKLFLKLLRRDDLAEFELQALRESVSATRDYKADDVIVEAGEPLSHSSILLEGLVCRSKDLSDGRRQIMEVHVPGDFIDLHGFLLKKLEHNLECLTPARIAQVPHERLKTITERWPHLSRMLWHSTLVDAALHREKILSVGRRSALSRLAHLFCELHVRFGVVEMVDGLSYALPLTQSQLADAAGLTQVHVNRTLRELRDRGLVIFRNGRVDIQDWDRLVDIAEFDPAYLYLDKQPR